MTSRKPAKSAIPFRAGTKGKNFVGLEPAETQPRALQLGRMRLKLLASLLCCLGSAAAQSISITSPSSGAIMAGTAQQITCSVSSISTLAWVELIVDGETQGYWAVNEPHSCPVITWNPYAFGNGASHTVQVIALDATKAAIATSVAQTNPIENYNPQGTCAFNAPPSNACADLATSIAYASSLTWPGSNLGWWSGQSYVSIKPSGGSPPAIVGSSSVQSILGSMNPASIASPSRTTTAANLIVVQIMGGNSSGIDALTSLTDNDGGGSTNLLASTSTTGCTAPHNVYAAVRTCWHANVGTNASYQVAAGFSNAQARGAVIRVWEVSGAPTTNAIDVSGSNGGNLASSTKTIVMASGPLAAPGSNEMMMYFVSIQPTDLATFVNATAGPEYTLVQDANLYTASEYTIDTTGWYGQMAASITVNGANAGESKTFNCYIDGASSCQPQAGNFYFAAPNGYNAFTTATSGVLYFDTNTTISSEGNISGFYNGSHQALIMAYGDGSNCNGGGCPWSTMGQWEQTATFANPVLPVELTMTYRDQKAVCPGAIPSSCSSTSAVSGTVHFTDGSTAPATLSSCGASSQTSYATVALTSNTCAWSPVALGSAAATVTEGTYGLTRTNWFNVVAANNYPNIGTDATIQPGYVPGNTSKISSIWTIPCFTTFDVDSGDAFPGYTASQCAQDLAASGVTVVEEALGNGSGAPPGSTPGWNYPSSESAYDARVQADINAVCSPLSASGLHVGFQSDNFTANPGNSLGLYSGQQGYAGTFTTKPLTYIYSAWFSICPSASPRLNGMKDEITYSQWTGAFPVVPGGGQLGAANGPTQIVVSGGTATVTWPGYPHSGTGPVFNSAGTFVLSGSGCVIGTGGNCFDYSTTQVSPTAMPTLVANYASNTTFTFPAPPGVANGTYTASSNNCGSSSNGTCANIVFNVFAQDTMDATGTIIDGVAGGTPPISWPTNSNFLNYHTQAHLGNSKALLTYQPHGGANSYANENNWCGNPNIADYCDLYTLGYANYNQISSSIPGSISYLGDVWRQSYGNLFATKPTTILVQARGADYAMTGYPVAVTNCVGNAITTATPHSLANVLVGVSRLWVSGSTGCNGEYYILSTPTATTITVSQNLTSSPSATGTITFVGGGSFSGVNLGYFGTAQGGFNDPNCSTDGIKNHRGQNFTTSTGNSTWDSGAWNYSIFNVDACDSRFGDVIRQIPNLSSTGGTAHIIPTNSMTPGQNLWYQSDGPQNIFSQLSYAMILGATGSRMYGFSLAVNAFDRTNPSAGWPYSSNTSYLTSKFEDGSTYNFDDIQAGLHPKQAITPWTLVENTCAAYANLLWNRLTPWWFEPSLPAPDYGFQYESGAHQDSSGNTMLAIQQLLNGSSTLKTTLTPYLISGQPIIRFVASCDGGIAVTTLSPGTASDTVTGPAGWLVAYLFLQNPASVLNQPAISALLSDIPGAAKVQVLYSYSPFVFGQQHDLLPQIYACGAGACTLPVDRNIGSIYYEIQYLDLAGHVLSTGAMGQL